MLYRKFGNTDEKVSILGFGCMRLPVIDGKEDQIDEEEATRMIEFAIEKGLYGLCKQGRTWTDSLMINWSAFRQTILTFTSCMDSPEDTGTR
jgi:hypothetical protein